MPLIRRIKTERDSDLALWKIEEDLKYFSQNISNIEEHKILDKVSSPAKKLQKLAARFCLREMLELNSEVKVCNEISGKPYLTCDNNGINRKFMNISLSHGKELCGSMSNSKFKVGLDVEWMNPNRSFDTIKMFMNEEETQHYNNIGRDFRYFYLVWCAKECLYKLYNSFRKEISFKRHLYTDSNFIVFTISDKPIGKFSFTAGIKRDDIISKVTIKSFISDDYMICYTELDDTNSNEIQLLDMNI